MGTRQIGSVDSMAGNVTLRHPDGSSEQLHGDSILYIGDVVSAGDQAHARLRLVDGSMLDIRSGQVVALDESLLPTWAGATT